MTRSGHTRWRVSPQARVVSRRDALVLLAPDGARQLDGDSAMLVRALLDALHQPRTRDELLHHVRALSDGPIENPHVIDEAIALLLSVRAIDVVDDRAPPPSRGRLLLGISGAIAAATTPELIARLQHAGFEVRVMLTPSAARFVSPRVLEALTHAPVARSLWRRQPRSPAPHMALAEWAELVLICPASATTIARLATGDASELVAATVLATRASVPVVIVPSMNPSMYASPVTQRNLEQLRNDGRWLVGSGAGVEVADAPDARAASGGAPPSWAAVVDVVAFVAGERARPDWDALYAAAPAPPFCADAFDPDVGEALASRGITSGRVLDCGCGTGSVANELARRGFTVRGIDVSARAIELARAQEGAAAVRFIVGDALTLTPDALALDGDDARAGSFDVVIDRGCMHALTEAQQHQWAQRMATLVRKDGLLVVKTLSRHARAPWHTRTFTVDELQQLVAAPFALEAAWESVFQGPQSPPPRALVAVFRRR